MSILTIIETQLIYDGMFMVLAEVFHAESELEKTQETTQETTVLLKFEIRLKDLLSGKLHVLSD